MASHNRTVSRDLQLYWCYQCHRTVRIIAGSLSDIVCPRCYGQFLVEIEGTPRRPRLVVDFTQYDPSPDARLLEALSLIHVPPIRHLSLGSEVVLLGEPRRRLPWLVGRAAAARQDDENDVFLRRRWRRTRRNRSLGGEDDIESDIIHTRPRTSIIIPPIDPSLTPRITTTLPGSLVPWDYLAGLDSDLIEEITQNDRPGPPPAPESSINAIPTIKISDRHLINGGDSQCCPVCKEEFKVGGQARELPCSHIYHSECIIPWLRLHNSCPICRKVVPAAVSTSDSIDGDSDSRDGEGRCSRWLRGRNLWPPFLNS
ncbi:hypothetical protein SAY86_005317 [Trapa natans]|uniref:RING-type E3 ubiquitin transferase n=1 Tax=Trapa natans TaxID=22666 RepID=A0AAN7QRC1_TRANT|nr:hypothetical protein SAY86_005317 [Trapa natans]